MEKMMRSWLAKIISTFWSVSLFLWVILLELFTFYPLHVPNFVLIRPCVALVAVYYFTIYAHRYFNMVMVFIAGFLADLLFMLPMGTYVLVFLALYVMTDILRKPLIDKPFFVLWIGFALLSLVTSVLAWLVVAISAGRFTDFLPMFVSYLVLVSLYPFVAAPCYLVLKLLLKAKRYE